MATKDTGGQRQTTRRSEEAEDAAPEAAEEVKERQEKLTDDVEAILDEFDDFGNCLGRPDVFAWRQYPQRRHVLEAHPAGQVGQRVVRGGLVGDHVDRRAHGEHGRQ